MSNELHFFEVYEEGTIVNPNVKDPTIRSDAFFVSLDGVQTPKDLIVEVEGCPPLAEHFRLCARERLDELEDPPTANDGPVSVDRLQKMMRLVSALKSEEDGWKEWIRIEGQERLRWFKKNISDWLAEEIDYAFEGDWISPGLTSQGNAMAFFEEELEADVADALGVGIVDGEYPGSSYYAAVLRKPIEEANQVAERLGLPFRFRRYRGQ